MKKMGRTHMSERLGIPANQKNEAMKEIQVAMKNHPDARMYKRYQTILMLLQGESYQKISAYTGVGLASLYNYSAAYREQGIAGLERGKPTGRPSKLTPEQEQILYETIVHKTPVEVGFPVEMNWTSPLIRQWMEREWNVSYSDRGTREVLYRLNLSFTKPTYTLEKADPIKQEVFKEEFEILKKNWSTKK